MLILKQFNKLISANLDKEENTGFYFILEEVKETVFEFSQVTLKFCECNIIRDLIFINIKMTQYNSLNVKLSDSQFNKLKSTIKNETEVVLWLSSNMIGGNETNFPHKLLLNNRQVANLRKAFANYLSTDIKSLKLSYLRWYNH